MANSEEKIRKKIENAQKKKLDKAARAVEEYSRKVEDINPNLPAKEPGKIKKWFKKMRVYIALGLGITTIGIGSAAVATNNKEDKLNDDKKLESLESSNSIKKGLKELVTDKEINNEIEEQTTEEQTVMQEQIKQEVEKETQKIVEQYKQAPQIEQINQENNVVVSEDIGKSVVQNETAKTDLDKNDDVVIKSTETTEKKTEAEKETETKKVVVSDKTISIDENAKVEDGTIKAEDGDTHVEVEIVEKESTEAPEIVIEPENPFADDIEAYVVTPEEAAKNKKNIAVEITEDGEIDGKDIAAQIDEYYK